MPPLPITSSVTSARMQACMLLTLVSYLYHRGTTTVIPE
jgi:hypothetical protein